MKLEQLAFNVAIIGAVALTALGCRPTESSSANPSNSTGAAAIERVTVGNPQRKTLVLTTSQPARIEAFEETPLYAKLAGFVKKVHVDIGDRVAAGQSLVTLGIPELVDDVDQKRAMLSQAEAVVAQATSHVDAVQAAAETATARIAEAHAEVTRATGEYERWKAEYARIKRLSDNGSVTEKMADETLNQLRAAEAARDGALAAVQSTEAAAREAKANVRKAESDRMAADAQLSVAAADLAHAKTMVSYSEVQAPFDGVITRRSIDTGHFVQPAGGAAAKPLLVIARVDRVRVFMDVPEMEAALVDVGDAAALSIQALNGTQMKTSVTRTSWSLDQLNQSLRVEIDLDNNGELLRPGMYAVGTIELERRENALVLPATAIVRDDANAYCNCIQDSKVDRRKIEIGLRSGPEVEVVSGIDEESTVALNKADSLQHGQTVEVIKAPQ